MREPADQSGPAQQPASGVGWGVAGGVFRKLGKENSLRDFERSADAFEDASDYSSDFEVEPSPYRTIKRSASTYNSGGRGVGAGARKKQQKQRRKEQQEGTLFGGLGGLLGGCEEVGS